MIERPFASTYDATTSTLAVTGAVGEDVEPDFERALVEALARTSGVLRIDLSEVDYLPSSALGTLISVTRPAPAAGADGRPYELVAAPGSVAARVLEICGLPHRPA